MTMTKDLGKLLITIDNAVMTVFNDDACITHIVPSPQYSDEGIILDITISVFKDKFSKEVYDTKMRIFDELVYNPLFHSEHILSKVNIVFKELNYG